MKTQAPRSPTLYPLLLAFRPQNQLGRCQFSLYTWSLEFSLLQSELSFNGLFLLFSLPFLDTCGEIIFRLSLLSLGSQEFGALSQGVQGVEPPGGASTTYSRRVGFSGLPGTGFQPAYWELVSSCSSTVLGPHSFFLNCNNWNLALSSNTLFFPLWSAIKMSFPFHISLVSNQLQKSQYFF